MPLPWQDRAGTFAPIRATACVLAVLPLIWLFFLAMTDDLGERPIVGAIHLTGDWAIRLLLVTLAITPLRRISGWSKLIGARQIFGLAAFGFAALHLSLFAYDLHFHLPSVLNEIVRRIYLGLGMVAFIGLAILAAHSGVEAVRRLGAEAWNNLHKLIYPIAALGLLHFFIQSKLNVDQPVLMTGFFFWLMGFRFWAARGWRSTPALVALALVSAVATQAIELAWYAAATTVPTSRIISRIFDFSYDIRMMWIVLAVSLAVASLPAAFNLKPRAASQR